MVPTMTTKDLSEKTGVSESSVVRFCKTIGMASFKTFKLELVKNLTLTESHMTDFSILQQKILLMIYSKKSLMGIKRR